MIPVLFNTSRQDFDIDAWGWNLDIAFIKYFVEQVLKVADKTFHTQ